MDTQDSAPLNALQANIKKSGQNSYYYAHSDSSGGLRSTLGESPRLLEVNQSTSGIIRPIIPINTFAWSDAEKNVKIYIEFDNALILLKDEDIVINLRNEGRSLDVTINDESKKQTLLFKRERLHAKVTSVKAKRLDKRIIITLTKEDKEGTWYELESKGNFSEDD